MNLLPKLLLTVAAIQYGIIPPIVDLSESHVFHVNWPPHARFHMVWLLCVGTSIACYALYLTWGPADNRQRNLRQVSILGCLVLAGFFCSALMQTTYGGALSDPNHQVLIFGIDGNLVSFSLAGLFQGIGSYFVWRNALRQSV